jgi:hypothetical protein
MALKKDQNNRRIDLPYTLDNEGRKVYTLDNLITNCELRPASVEVQVDAGKASNKPDKCGEDPNPDNEDDAPPDDGMIRQRWRTISTVKAWPQNAWGFPILVDYGWDGGKALKSAVGLINGPKPDLTKDHSSSIDAVFGHIENAKWEDSKDIPPGVNADLVVDPELYPMEAKRLDKGAYRSSSIGIDAEMVRHEAHKDMDDWDFLVKMGKKVNGEEVRLLLKKVKKVRHHAVIAAYTGADPNAGLRNSLEDPATNINQNISAGGTKPMKKWLLALLNRAFDKFKLDRAADWSTLEEAPEGFEAMFNGRVDALVATFEEHSALVAKLHALEGYVKNEGEVGLNTSEIADRLEGKLELAVHGKAHLESRRAEAKKYLSMVESDNSKKETLSDLAKRRLERLENTKDLDFIEDELAHYKALAEEKFDLNRSSSPEELLPLKPGQKKQGKGRDDSVSRYLSGGEKK